jgi:hypothetical protein
MTREKDLYLPEDQDLLDGLKAYAENDINVLQTRAFLRTRKTMVDLDKSNGKLQTTVLALALIQFVIGGFQLILQLVDAQDKHLVAFMVVALLGTMVWLGRSMTKVLNQEDHTT